MLGLDARALTPLLVARVVVAAAETRSFQRAEIVMAGVAGQAVSDNTIQRVVRDVGEELAERRDHDPKHADALAQWPEDSPELAVVECDGGRIRCREPGRGRGVHLAGEGWRETKNACLVRAKRQTFEEDPQPEPPPCFRDPKHVAKIAETEALSVAAPLPAEPFREEPGSGVETQPAEVDWRPKRLVRTVLASMANSDTFGRQMRREAKRRRFFEAPAKAFLGDGLPWNWSIQKKEFRGFTPILDFTHALSYLFVVATAVHGAPADAWDQYLAWMRGCWRGEIDQVLAELGAWQHKLGRPPENVPDNDPRKLLAKTIGYLTNNRSRMDYAAYRKQGLPVTTAWMESLVKEVNYRTKGTEMFWDDPAGAEAILQVRAAALCDDGRLGKHLRARVGSPFTRRPKKRNLPLETSKG